LYSSTTTSVTDKAKPRVIVGRKATDPRALGPPGCRSKTKGPDYRGFIQKGNPVFILGGIAYEWGNNNTNSMDHYSGMHCGMLERALTNLIGGGPNQWRD
jgi:hypothetical protein